MVEAKGFCIHFIDEDGSFVALGEGEDGCFAAIDGSNSSSSSSIGEESKGSGGGTANKVGFCIKAFVFKAMV